MESKVAKVTNIPAVNIGPNPHNPRRLFDEKPMQILEESIQKLGILVPVSVYPKISGSTDPKNDKFILLDGERRWRCSNELKLKEIPAIIIDKPSEEQNILTMFHIHNVREGWQLMPTALKLQTLMEKLEETNERKLNELTRLSISQIRRCKVLLTYPKKFQSMMLAPPSERFKADFFIDLQRIRGIAKEEQLKPWIKRGDIECIEIMIKKYNNEIIKSVTEFRILVSLYRGAERTNQISRFIKEFEKFLSDPKMTIMDINIPGASFEKEISEVKISSKRLFSQLNNLNLEIASTDPSVIGLLKKVSKLINKKLEEAYLDGPQNDHSEKD